MKLTIIMTVSSIYLIIGFILGLRYSSQNTLASDLIEIILTVLIGGLIITMLWIFLKDEKDD